MTGAWKRTVLVDWDEGAIADATTTQNVKLPQAIIGAIHLRLSGTGGAGTPAVDDLITEMKVKTEKGYIHDMLSADQHVLTRALSGRQPIVTNASGAYTQTTHTLYFGRYPRDTKYMLDLRNSNVRQIELSFGTLIATTAWATGTVVLTVTIDEWVGDASILGTYGWKLVESRATGTGKTVFDLYQGYRCVGMLINIGTITTIRQCTLGDKKESVIFSKANFRDLLNLHNSENNVDTAETVYALMKFFGDGGDSEIQNYPDLGKLSDPAFSIERGATTSTTRIHQGMLF